MAYMTDNEFQNLMDEVLRIVKESESKDEAVEKLQGLIENKNSKIWFYLWAWRIAAYEYLSIFEVINVEKKSYKNWRYAYQNR